MLSSSRGASFSIFPAPLLFAIFLILLALFFRSFKLNFFVILLGYVWVFLTIIAIIVSWKKYGFEESKGIVIIMLFCFYPYLFAPIIISNSIEKEIKIHKKYAKEKITNYQPCKGINCHQNFIVNDNKNSKYKVEITEKCVTMKPLHNYDFLYYEVKKCGDEITEKEYHSTVKFLKNVALLKFNSVF